MSEKKKSTGRKCSVCTHKRVKEINSLINQEKSFRYFSLPFGMSAMSVQRHVEKCLKLEIKALIKQKKIENAVDHYQEITEQLTFAKDLRLAAREYLLDPEIGAIVLFPRSDEVTVIYEDLTDLTPKGYPKKKTDDLETLLKRAEAGKIEVSKTVIKHVDIRSFALDAIRTTDLVLDKIARLEGLYTKEKENSDELTQLKKQIQSRADSRGVSYQEELNLYLSLFGSTIKSDIKQELTSNLVQ